MTSKEQLIYYKQQCEEQANYIIELKERLETLESDLYKTSKIVTSLLNKNLALEQENEKLKKAIKLLKYLFDMDFELCSTTDKESVYLLSGDCYMRISSESVDVDLLNEVLGNA